MHYSMNSHPFKWIAVSVIEQSIRYEEFLLTTHQQIHYHSIRTQKTVFKILKAWPSSDRDFVKVTCLCPKALGPRSGTN